MAPPRLHGSRSSRLLIAPLAAVIALALPGAPRQSHSASVPKAPGVTASWWSTAQQDIARSEYHITWQHCTGLADLAEAYQAPNRAQNLRTYFTKSGIRVIPRTTRGGEKPAWEWGLALAAWGREGALEERSAAPAQAKVEGDRIEYQRGDLTEWYVNDSRGLEEGFTIARRPGANAASSVSGGLGLLDVELAVSGSLTASLSGDRREVDFVAPGGARPIHLDHLRVVDAHRHVLQASFERRGDVAGKEILAIVVDDRHAAYPITIDPLATSPDWTAESDKANAIFGTSVATAGDVNGDGFSDVIVGAPFFDNGQSGEGRAFVYHGSASGLSLTANWTAESNQANARFGQSVATAGDVNGDGFSDVIVGAPRFDNGQTDEGRAFVYHGSASGLSLTANWTAERNQAGEEFGNSVATAGDVNGDGFSDVIVGAHLFDGAFADNGLVSVYHGSASGLALATAWNFDGGELDEELGSSAATAGDVNGDGFSDVIVGAPLFHNGQSGEGRALVFHGSASGLSLSVNWAAEGNAASVAFGGSVATAGDVNGDGFSDVIVGEVGFFLEEGRAVVYHGSSSGLSLTANWTADGPQESAFFGSSVAPAGDVNGDGFSDVVVGAPGFDISTSTNSNEGKAFVYLGSASGLSLSSAWTDDIFQSGALFGTSVATAGDVNGDGFSDLIIGSPNFDNGQTDEGRAFVYQGSASGLSLASNWTAESGQANGQLGLVVATAGDVNGDGFSDVIVGAPLFDNGQTDEGRALVYDGSASGPSLTADWTAEGNQASAEFGYSVATAGDVNGDGLSDVIVGALLFDNGQTNEGRAFVYHGSASGLSLTANWTAESDQAGALFGESVATAGDVNGDGFSDVIVGARLFDNGQTDEGRVFVYQGSAGGLSLTANWTAESDQANSGFGRSVATAGDVNRDGFSDVIVGAPLFDNGQADEGRAFVYHGSAVGLNTVASWIAESNQAGAEFGHSVATAGDVNGDGYSDVIVGAPDFDNGQTDEGRTFVYYGNTGGLSPSGLTTESEQSPLGISPAWTAESDQAGAIFGLSVATAGDVNGDGFSDVIVGAPNFANGQTFEGRAFVYLGSPSGPSLAPDWTAESDQATAQFGYSVAMAGDVNGDGFSDVIVGAPLFDNGQSNEGRAFVYYGNGGPGRRPRPRQFRTDAVTLIAPLGVSDNQTQFRIGATALSIYGRTRLQMEHEVKPRGMLFNGLNTVPGGFFDTGSDGQVNFGRLVSGLTPGGVYHWRVRAKYDLVKTPFQRNGPWVTMPTNGWNEADLRTPGGPVSVAPGGPARFELMAAGANPGRGRCGVMLVMAQSARVHAEVHDVLGRIVAVLIDDQAYEAGSHLLMWDGREQTGTAAPTGVYFVLVRAGGAAAVRKAVLAR